MQVWSSISVVAWRPPCLAGRRPSAIRPPSRGFGPWAANRYGSDVLGEPAERQPAAAQLTEQCCEPTMAAICGKTSALPGPASWIFATFMPLTPIQPSCSARGLPRSSSKPRTQAHTENRSTAMFVPKSFSTRWRFGTTDAELLSVIQSEPTQTASHRASGGFRFYAPLISARLGSRLHLNRNLRRCPEKPVLRPADDHLRAFPPRRNLLRSGATVSRVWSHSSSRSE